MNDKNKNILTAASPRRLFYMAILFLAAATVAVNLGQGRVFWQTLARGRWWWVVLASCLQLVFLLNQSALYTMIYRMFKLPARLGHFFLLVISAAFVSAVVPGGTLSGSGLILYDAQAKRLDLARSLLANLVYYLFDYLAFLVILALALCYLLNRGSLKEYEIVAAVILVTSFPPGSFTTPHVFTGWYITCHGLCCGGAGSATLLPERYSSFYHGASAAVNGRPG